MDLDLVSGTIIMVDVGELQILTDWLYVITSRLDLPINIEET